MGRTTELRHEIKQRLNPLMAQKGFVCDTRRAPQFVTFRKIAPDAVYVIEVQWEKYGRPRFIINFGKCGPAGTICHGDRVYPEHILPSLPPHSGHLLPGSGPSTSSWFRQDRRLVERLLNWSRDYPAADVVTRFLELLHEVEEFWARGTIGPHIRFVPVPKAAKEWVKDVV